MDNIGDRRRRGKKLMDNAYTMMGEGASGKGSGMSQMDWGRLVKELNKEADNLTDNDRNFAYADKMRQVALRLVNTYKRRR